MTIPPAGGAVNVAWIVSRSAVRSMLSMRMAYPPVRCPPSNAATSTRPCVAAACGTSATIDALAVSVVPTISAGGPSYFEACVVATSLYATAPCAGAGPAAPAQAPRKIARTPSLHTDREAVGEDLGEAARSDASLRLGHLIRGTIEGGGPGDRVEHCVRGPRIAVARLADAPRVDQALRSKRVRGPGLRTQLAQALALSLEERWDVRVPVAGEGRLGASERRRGRRHARDVLPHRIAQAPVTQREALDRLDRRQTAEEIAFRGGQPLRVQLRRDRRAVVEKLEPLAGRDGAVVIALQQERAATLEEREDVGRIRAVADGVARRPQRFDALLPQRREHGLERLQVGVHVGDEPYAQAAMASASVRRPTRNARPTTTEVAPHFASARMSSTSRTPPPVWKRMPAPVACRSCSRSTSGGPPRLPSPPTSMTYRSRTPRPTAVFAAVTASFPAAKKTRSDGPPRGASLPSRTSISTIAPGSRAQRETSSSSPKIALEKSTPVNPAARAACARSREPMPPARRQRTPEARATSASSAKFENSPRSAASRSTRWSSSAPSRTYRSASSVGSRSAPTPRRYATRPARTSIDGTITMDGVAPPPRCAGTGAASDASCARRRDAVRGAPPPRRAPRSARSAGSRRRSPPRPCAHRAAHARRVPSTRSRRRPPAGMGGG